MKILIATDSFKDALPALEVCQAIEAGIKRAMPQADVQLFPLADGGEGTSEILTYHSKGQRIQLEVKDPLFRSITASYGLSEDGQTAFIDMAEASGLQLLNTKERNPKATSTYGTGQLVVDALQKGVKHILLGIGGSATNDAGMGLAQALGYRFYDEKGKELEPIGANLGLVRNIVKGANRTDLDEVKVEVICDVNNPLFGEQGAAHIYAAQKGADEVMIKELDIGLRSFAKQLNDYFQRDFSNVPGAGAAGGLGGGAMAFLGARLRPGITTVMEFTHFANQLKAVDLLITGEGKIDNQTLHGKLIKGICSAAQKHQIPVIALCGTLTADLEVIEQIGLTAAISILSRPVTLSDALLETAVGLEQTAFHLMKTRFF